MITFNIDITHQFNFPYKIYTKIHWDWYVSWYIMGGWNWIWLYWRFISSR